MPINIDKENCDECGTCISVCPSNAIELTDTLAIDDACTSCGACISICPVGALTQGKNP